MSVNVKCRCKGESHSQACYFYNKIVFDWTDEKVRESQDSQLALAMAKLQDVNRLWRNFPHAEALQACLSQEEFNEWCESFDELGKLLKKLGCG